MKARTEDKPVSVVYLFLFVCHLVQPSTSTVCQSHCSCSGHVTLCVNYTSLPTSFSHSTQSLHFQASKFSIPQHAFQNYTSMEHLTISNGYISFVDDRAFADTPVLDYLQLENNIFKVISAGVFDGLSRLTKLKLYNNNINNIPAGMFRDLQGLQWMLFEHSPTSLQLQENSFQGLQNLIVLSLGNNQLGVLNNPNILQGLDRLEELIIPNNQLTDITDGMFSFLTKLKTLDLSYNSLKSLNSEIFSPGLPGLETLKLRYNPLNDVPETALNRLPGLKVLDLQATRIHLIEPSAFTGIPHLRYINLNDNSDMDIIPTVALNTLKHLTQLQLSNNRITALPALAFQNLSSLTHLYISHTQLRSVDKDALRGLDNIQVLELSFNRLRSMPGGVFSPITITEETYINLHSNPWSCDCQLKDFIVWNRKHFNSSSMLQTATQGLLCQSPYKFKGMSFDDIPVENFTCASTDFAPAGTLSATSHSMKVAIYICVSIVVTVVLTVVALVSICLYRRLRKKVSQHQQARYNRLRLPMRLWDDVELQT
ncbi:platelet glycoprotein V-like [Ptychodera flava]|uniref:platelet glycoprotein V-like n=1 Tax=Ptychodera flava TaxID=63121 RepID=UPI00396A7D4D